MSEHVQQVPPTRKSPPVIQNGSGDVSSCPAATSRLSSSAKKTKQKVFSCSELENSHASESAGAAPVSKSGPSTKAPAWTEVEDNRDKRTIHDVKKRFVTEIENKTGVSEDDIKQMIRNLNAAIELDRSDYQLFFYRADCYSRLSRYKKALKNVETALENIPVKNRITQARVNMRKADLLQKLDPENLNTELIFQTINKSIDYDIRESYRLLCEDQMPIFVRYAACVGLMIAYDEDARAAAANTTSVKQALRYAVKRSGHFKRLVFSPYRMGNMQIEVKVSEDLFLDCIIGRVIRDVTHRIPSQLHDWYQDLDTPNQLNWTSLYVGNLAENCKEKLEDILRRYGDTECRIISGSQYDYQHCFSLNRYDNWLAPVFAMEYLQGQCITGINPNGWPMDVKPKLRDGVPIAQKLVPNHSASIHFQKVLACSPTGEDDIIISNGLKRMLKFGLKKIKPLVQMSDLTAKKLDIGFDAMKNQEHAEKNDEKGLNVYRLLHHVLDSVMERNRLILVANRDCLVALSKMDWDERVKICSYHYSNNGYMIIFLKRGFPDEFVDANRKREIGTTKSEFRGNQYQSLNHVTQAVTAGTIETHDFLTLNEVLLKNGSDLDIKMLVCTEIDGELDGEYCEIKYRDVAIDTEYDKKADWCLFSKFSGHNLKLRIGERRDNRIISHDFTVDQILEDAKVRELYDRKVNLMYENVKRVIRNSEAGQVYVVDLGSLNPEYYKVLGDVHKYNDLYFGKPLVPFELLESLNGFGYRSSFSSVG